MCNTKIGRALLTSLKATAGMSESAVMIPVGSKPVAFLRPVATKKNSLNPQDVQNLTEWRNITRRMVRYSDGGITGKEAEKIAEYLAKK